MTNEEIPTLNYSVTSGEVSFSDEKEERRIKSAQMTWIGEIDADIFIYKNVQLVNQLFTKGDWNFIFPTQQYQYIAFLTAVAQYPAFCNEFKNDVLQFENLETLAKSCKRELATLFAHIIFESGDTANQDLVFMRTGLSQPREQACTGDKPLPESCKYQDEYGDEFGDEEEQEFGETENYFGRGPIHLRWKSKYAQFSRAYFDNDFQGEYRRINDPGLLLGSKKEGFASALWHYMTPVPPQPSTHDVVTGFFKASKSSAGIAQALNNFGSTIAIMAMDQSGEFTEECFHFGEEETSKAQQRAFIYTYLIDYLGLSLESDLGCAETIVGDWGDPWAGIDAYWTPSLDQDQCELVIDLTPYSVYNADDYKKCVCASSGANPFACPQEEEYQQICQWEEQQISDSKNEVNIFNEGQEVILDIYQLVVDNQLQFQDCTNDKTGETFKPDFYTIELVRDNLGRQVTDSDFRQDYQNINDTVLQKAPSNAYIAAQLGQSSLVYSEIIQNQFQFDYRRDYHRGTWDFMVKACIQDNEDSSIIFCDLGLNVLFLEFIEVCDTANASQHKECDESNENPELEPKPEPQPEPVDEPTNTDPLEPEEEIIQENEEILIPPFVNPNNKPYFVAYDPNKIFEVARDSELLVQLPLVFDEDIRDKVTITAQLTETMESWITFQPTSRQFFLQPNQLTPLGNTKVQVSLNDTKSTSEYLYNFWVNPTIEQEITQPLEPVLGKNDTTEIQPESNSGNSGPKISSTGIQQPNKQSTSNIQQFDIATIQARGQLKQRKESLLLQLPQVSPDKFEQLEDPVSVINFINEIGEVNLIFNQDMYLNEILKDFKFSSKSKIGNDDDKKRQLQGEQQVEVDLSSILKSRIYRGDEFNSAPINKLGFKVLLDSFDEKSMKLQIKFEHPLSVSIGQKPDTIEIIFVESELFLSKETGKSIAPDTILKHTVPKQFPSQAAYSIAVVTGNSVQVTTNAAFLSQFGITICLAVSLKAMWILMEVMQVIAYLRLIVNWPANSLMILQSMHDAITLENIVDELYDQIQDKFKPPEDDPDSESLKQYGISYDSVYLMFGAFGIFLCLLILVLVLYMVGILIEKHIRCIRPLRNYIKSKMFYNGWIRYFIVSNLIMTHDCVFYLYFSGQFTDLVESIKTSFIIFILTIIVICPFFMAVFLYCNRKKLDLKSFRTKFRSMYGGIKTKTFLAYMYTSVFCIRRLLLVCALLGLLNRSYWPIFAYNGIQTFYFAYITTFKPHEETIHNKLETFNEISIILIQYVSICFISESDIDLEMQWEIGNVCMFLIAFIFLVNVMVLLYMNFHRILAWTRMRKARKAHKNEVIQKKAEAAKQQLDKKQFNLNIARRNTQLVKELSPVGDNEGSNSSSFSPYLLATLNSKVRASIPKIQIEEEKQDQLSNFIYRQEQQDQDQQLSSQRQPPTLLFPVEDLLYKSNGKQKDNDTLKKLPISSLPYDGTTTAHTGRSSNINLRPSSNSLAGFQGFGSPSNKLSNQNNDYTNRTQHANNISEQNSEIQYQDSERQIVPENYFDPLNITYGVKEPSYFYPGEIKNSKEPSVVFKPQKSTSLRESSKVMPQKMSSIQELSLFMPSQSSLLDQKQRQFSKAGHNQQASQGSIRKNLMSHGDWNMLLNSMKVANETELNKLQQPQSGSSNLVLIGSGQASEIKSKTQKRISSPVTGLFEPVSNLYSPNPPPPTSLKEQHELAKISTQEIESPAYPYIPQRDFQPYEQKSKDYGQHNLELKFKPQDSYRTNATNSRLHSRHPSGSIFADAGKFQIQNQGRKTVKENTPTIINERAQRLKFW